MKRTRAQQNADKGWDLGEVNPTRKPKPQAKVTTPQTRAVNNTPKTAQADPASMTYGPQNPRRAAQTPTRTDRPAPRRLPTKGTVTPATATRGTVSPTTAKRGTVTSSQARQGSVKVEYTKPGAPRKTTAGQNVRDFFANIYRWGQN